MQACLIIAFIVGYIAQLPGIIVSFFALNEMTDMMKK
jgi:hypothetical protein